jgi:prepilin-type N-terminal cleavage/methylation domain-containing protein
MSAPGRAVRSRPAFTLVELLVVFTILALATAIAVPAFRSLLKQDDMTAATQRIEALFQLARDSAIRGGEPVTVVMDSVTGEIWLEVPSVSDPFAEPGSEATPARAAPRVSSSARMFAETMAPGESLALPAAVRIGLGRARARFTFAPTGAAFADTLVLQSSLEARHVTLNRWTGDVVVR